MKLLAALMIAAASCMCAATPAFAGPHATLDEAKTLVKKARAYIREVGRDKAFAEFDKRDGKFVDRDLYIYVYDKSLKNLAHGGNSKLIGKDLADMKDVDGKYPNRGLLEAAMKGGGTYEFKFFNPVDGKIQRKIGYAEMEGDLMVGSGVYADQ